MDKRSKRKFQKSTSTRKIDGALIIFGDIGYNNTRSLFVEAQKELTFFSMKEFYADLSCISLKKTRSGFFFIVHLLHQ